MPHQVVNSGPTDAVVVKAETETTQRGRKPGDPRQKFVDTIIPKKIVPQVQTKRP
jgi:hypothetical protein